MPRHARPCCADRMLGAVGYIGVFGAAVGSDDKPSAVLRHRFVPPQADRKRVSHGLGFCTGLGTTLRKRSLASGTGVDLGFDFGDLIGWEATLVGVMSD